MIKKKKHTHKGLIIITPVYKGGERTNAPKPADIKSLAGILKLRNLFVYGCTENNKCELMVKKWRGETLCTIIINPQPCPAHGPFCKGG